MRLAAFFFCPCISSTGSRHTHLLFSFCVCGCFFIYITRTNTNTVAHITRTNTNTVAMKIVILYNTINSDNIAVIKEKLQNKQTTKNKGKEHTHKVYTHIHTDSFINTHTTVSSTVNFFFQKRYKF